jgi:hypothetical protein
MSKRRKRILKMIFFIFSIFAVVLIVLQLTGNLQNTAARVSASVYVTFKYLGRGFDYQNVEFSPQFGDYNVTYKDKHGDIIGFTVTPAFFPVIVLYDPLDPGT